MSAAPSPFAIGDGDCTSHVHNYSLVFPTYWLQALLDRIEARFLHAVRTSLVINSFMGVLHPHVQHRARAALQDENDHGYDEKHR